LLKRAGGAETKRRAYSSAIFLRDGRAHNIDDRLPAHDEIARRSQHLDNCVQSDSYGLELRWIDVGDVAALRRVHRNAIGARRLQLCSTQIAAVETRPQRRTRSGFDLRENMPVLGQARNAVYPDDKAHRHQGDHDERCKEQDAPAFFTVIIGAQRHQRDDGE